MPKISLKRAASIAATLVLGTVGSLGILAASPAPAHAASCDYDTCFNVDPQTSECSVDAYTAGGVYGQIEVRYSPTCHATWLRDAQFGGFSFAQYLTQTSYNVYVEGLYTVTTPTQWQGSWTKMVPVPRNGYTQYNLNGNWSSLFNMDPGA